MSSANSETMMNIETLWSATTFSQRTRINAYQCLNEARRKYVSLARNVAFDTDELVFERGFLCRLLAHGFYSILLDLSYGRRSWRTTYEFPNRGYQYIFTCPSITERHEDEATYVQISQMKHGQERALSLKLSKDEFTQLFCALSNALRSYIGDNRTTIAEQARAAREEGPSSRRGRAAPAVLCQVDGTTTEAAQAAARAQEVEDDNDESTSTVSRECHVQ